MKFDFGSAFAAKESGKMLTAGIKDATFQGIELSTISSQKSGDTFKVMALKLDIEDYGEYTQNFFEPKSDERPVMQWGPTASPLDHFLITAREILEAVNPEIVEEINQGKVTFSGTFNQIVNKIKELTEPFIGTKVQIKLIPQNNGFVSMPGFPARITRNGELGISTRIIGHNLTLTAQENKRIEDAKNARPTNMANKVNVSDLLSDVKEDISSTDSSDDLPF